MRTAIIRIQMRAAISIALPAAEKLLRASVGANPRVVAKAGHVAAALDATETLAGLATGNDA